MHMYHHNMFERIGILGDVLIKALKCLLRDRKRAPVNVTKC